MPALFCPRCHRRITPPEFLAKVRSAGPIRINCGTVLAVRRKGDSVTCPGFVTLPPTMTPKEIAALPKASAEGADA